MVNIPPRVCEHCSPYPLHGGARDPRERAAVWVYGVSTALCGLYSTGFEFPFEGAT